jgi:hypothetical protein
MLNGALRERFSRRLSEELSGDPQRVSPPANALAREWFFCTTPQERPSLYPADLLPAISDV